MSHSPLKILLGALVLVVAGCGGDSDPAAPAGSENRPPKVSGPESVNAVVSTPVRFDVVATDPDGDALELTVSAVVSVTDWRLGIRAGVVGIEPETGRVTFTPNGNDLPQRTLVITAEDPSGEKTSIDVRVLVSGL